MKKNTTKKSMKNVEKKAARKPRLTKEEREARKLKLQEERAAKKAAKLAKREAKKQKEAEKKAVAKAKREERKAKKLARLQKQKEREAAKKLKAKERAEKKAAREAKKADKKPHAKKDTDAKKLSIQEKIEAERNEWKALSAIRRYVKDNAKLLASLPEDKRIKRINKLQKMGYSIGLNEDGIPSDIGYSFCTEIKIHGEKPAAEKPPKKERKPRTKKIEETQPQDSAEPIALEELPIEAEEKLLTDDEILEAAKSDTDAETAEEIPAGDTYKEEGEITEDSLKDPADVEEDPFGDDDGDDDEDDDILGGISREQEEYRHEAFREMEANGTWD